MLLVMLNIIPRLNSSRVIPREDQRIDRLSQGINKGLALDARKVPRGFQSGPAMHP